MSHNKNIDQMCEDLLDGIRRTNPELYDALVELGTLKNIVEAMEEKENLVEDRGQSLEQYVDDVVEAAKEKYGTASVVVVDEEGNVLRDTRDEESEDEDWDSYDEDWDSSYDEGEVAREDLDSSYGDGDEEWNFPVAVFTTHSPDGEVTRADFYTESAMLAYMEQYK